MKPERILVFQTAFLGDAILAIPLLKALRTSFPEAKLGFVCRRGVGPFFLESGLVQEVIEVDKTDSSNLKKAIKRTQNFKSDLIVSPHRSFRTAFWIWRLGARFSVGFKDPWTFFAYKKRVVRPKIEHDVKRQLSLLTGLGIDVLRLPQDILSLNVKIPSHEKFSSFSNYVALSPGSQWETKRWTEEGFIQVGRKLRADGLMVIVLGSSVEKELCQRVAQSIPGAVNLCGETTILELAQILKLSKFLICNDSGTMHVATAVGTPVVSIFGATIPSQGYAPWSKKAKIVEIDLSCRPCGAHGHNQCPLKHHDCMKKITSEQVLKATEEFLL